MGFLLFLVILSMIIHTSSIVSGILVVHKYEDCLQKLKLINSFDTKNFCAHRLWFVLLSICVSFGYLILGAELFVDLKDAYKGMIPLKYICMNLAVGVLILQFNYFILKDRRN